MGLMARKADFTLHYLIRAEIPVPRLREPYNPSKRSKKVRQGIYRTKIRPKEQDIVAICGH